MEYIKLPILQSKIEIQNPNEIPDGLRLHGITRWWNRSDKGSGIRIAILDTGISSHPDLEGQIESQIDLTGEGIQDDIGHGTHVAGIIAANENGSGIVGCCPQAKLLIVKVLGKANNTYDRVVKGINYAIDQKVDAINLSLGGKVDDPNLHSAIQRAVNSNIIVCVAVGNDGDGSNQTTESSYPGAYNEIITVGACDINKQMCSFSASNSMVDIVALGKDVVSLSNKGEGYVLMSGSSMSTPFVTGALCLIKNAMKKEYVRNLTESELFANLIKRTITLNYPTNVQGSGMLMLALDEMHSKIIEDEKLLKDLLRQS